MNDDELLDKIANVARVEREEARDAGWEELCDGSTDLDLLDDRLATEARDRGLFRPFDDAKLDAFAGIAEAGLAGGSLEREQKARVIPFRRSRAAALAAASAGLAAAAAFAIWLAFPSSSDLPPYHLASASGDVAMRSTDPVDTADTLELSSGGRFEIIVRPSQSVSGPVGAKAFVAQQGRITPLAVEPEVSPQGVVRVRGSVDQAALLLGALDFAVVVGRPEALPDRIQRLDSSGSDWQIVVVRARRVE